jgi:CelD/BcsL family acetyltransferase involved in cellulose biosynthesis
VSWKTRAHRPSLIGRRKDTGEAILSESPPPPLRAIPAAPRSDDTVTAGGTEGPVGATTNVPESDIRMYEDTLSVIVPGSLDDVAPEWDQLATACPTCHPQYLFDWVEPWWRLIGSQRHSLRLLKVEEAGHTVALAPLMLVRRRVRWLVSLRELQWLATGPSDQHDILSAGDAAAAGRAVARRLVQDRALWDELHLDCVPASSQAVEAMLAELSAGLKCSISVKAAPCYYIDTSTGDWDQYLATTSKKFVRRDLPRVRRRLAELGELTIRQDQGVDVDRVMAMASLIHQARQDELGRESGLADLTSRAFLTEAFERFHRRGLLSVWTLGVAGDVGGYLIGFKAGGVFYAWNMAHNPAYSLASPGKVLWASAIQDCFEDRTIDEFNMMRGDTEYKLKWTNTSRDLLDIRVRNLATMRSAALNRLRRRKV